MSGLSLHFYCGGAGHPLTFTEEEWYRQLRQALDMERAIQRNWGFVTGYGMEKWARLVIGRMGMLASRRKRSQRAHARVRH
ncbi:MAG: hypothetical protein E7662_08680 [Ruminococcaceae bacterium]|nr:hypothetical protein [Oscillospiraceae bacterium]